MPENSIQLSPSKLKKFIKHLCLATKAIEERDKAKQNLSEHLDKLKKLASSKAQQKPLTQGLKELEHHIDTALEKEKKAAHIYHHEPLHHEMLKKRMNELDTKLKSFTDVYTERQKKIANLEKKISNKVDQKQKQVQEIQDMIARLEEKYNEMAQTSNEKDLEKIKEKIQLLKSKLEKLKL